MIDEILSEENMLRAIKVVRGNKGAAGIDKMSVTELNGYFALHGAEIKQAIRAKAYQPQPVRRVYIPKANGKKRPLGIPTAIDRSLQQAVAQQLSARYDSQFSENSYGFRPNRSCHMAMKQVLCYLNEGYEWVVDLDIEKYFDTVNHDKLISILRERVNDAITLHLIRSFLKAGVMEDGLARATEEGVPQGGNLSPILSNIYLDKLDRELESRGLHFARYADDCSIFVKSEMAAERVKKSVTNWLERKLFLKVSVTKTKVCRPTKIGYLGFGFWKSKDGWKAKPLKDRQAKLYDKCREVLVRKRAVARRLSYTFTKLNQILRGWINYYSIGSMQGFMDTFGQWLRHKVRVIILKQWKKPKTVYRKLMVLNRKFKCNMTHDDIYKVANSRLGLYRRCGLDVINYLLSPKVLALPNKKEGRPALVNPLEYYKECLQ